MIVIVIVDKLLLLLVLLLLLLLLLLSLLVLLLLLMGPCRFLIKYHLYRGGKALALHTGVSGSNPAAGFALHGSKFNSTALFSFQLSIPSLSSENPC